MADDTINADGWKHGFVGAPHSRYDNVHGYVAQGEDWTAMVQDGRWDNNFTSSAVSAHKMVWMKLPIVLQAQSTSYATDKNCTGDSKDD